MRVRRRSRSRSAQEGRLLGDPDIRIGGVAEDEDVEHAPSAGRARRDLVDRLQRAPSRAPAPRCRSASAARCALSSAGSGASRIDAERAMRRVDQRDEAAERADEGQRDPGEQDDEQHQDRRLPARSGRRPRAPGTSRRRANAVSSDGAAEHEDARARRSARRGRERGARAPASRAATAPASPAALRPADRVAQSPRRATAGRGHGVHR